jgi:hypothetical protein
METGKQKIINPKSYIIANPIYDTVFKRLMENEEVAKFIVSALLGCPVISIEVKSQEITYIDEEESKIQIVALRLFRLDFVATIKTGANEYTKALIEVQKALKVANLRRFRKYIAEHYRREDVIDSKKVTLPIIGIYILGFELPEISTSCVRVNKSYYDAIHELPLDTKSHFIERIMHNCVVVQAGKIEKDRYITPLDKLLSVFEQDDFIDAGSEITKYFRHPIDDENIRRIIDILHYCASDADERKKIEAEHEAWETYQELLESYEKDNMEKLDKQSKIIVEQGAVIVEQGAVIVEQGAVIVETKAALAEKEVALAEKEAALAEKEAAIARERAEKEALLAELARLRNTK